MTTFMWILAILPSIILHEISHGWVANYYGDDTAKRAGRLSLNPLVHIDPFGTIILPVGLALLGLPSIGYAKPVPVNVNRLRRPRNQSVVVALAGPATNIVLVGVAIGACRLLYATHTGFVPATTANILGLRTYGQVNDWLLTGLLPLFFVELGLSNAILAAWNLLPIPPLDGSAVIERLVPRRHLRTYFQLRAQAMPIAMIVLFLALYLGFGSNVLVSLENHVIGWLF